MKVKNQGLIRHDTYIKEQYITEYAITSKSRYKHSNKFLLADGKIIRGNLNPWDMGIMPLTFLSSYRVSSSEENRIDIVATKVYGDASLYWVLCYFNNREDPLHLPIGTVLNIPNLADLYSYPNPLS